MDRQTVDHYLLMALLGAVLTLAMQYAGLKKKLDQLCDNGSEGGKNQISQLQAEPLPGPSHLR